MATILALRLSALGDVAMTVPVIYSFAHTYPGHDITIVTREQWSALFEGMPSNVHFYGVDLNDYRGIRGLSRLYDELKREHPGAVADFHDVLRTKYLDARFRMAGVKVSVITKGRIEKKELTRAEHKRLKPLKTSPERYADVLRRLGFQLELEFHSIFGDDEGDVGTLANIVGAKNENEWIGIAPFAKHEGKIYPPEMMERVIAQLCKRPGRRIFIFGGGSEERKTAEEWQARYPSVFSLIGKGRMVDELGVMRRTDVMLTMDSGNMHLAAITGVKVFSIWGATHPYAGFAAWGQTPDSFIQTDLPCRPCSVFGNRKCRRGDYACLRKIDPKVVVEKIQMYLESIKLKRPQ